MSEVRFVVREAGRDWSGTIHGSCADRAVAALSADPVTLGELEVATARFAKPRPGGRVFSNLSPSSNDEPYDAGLVVIDLAARLVVVDSTYSSPGREGIVWYHDDYDLVRELLWSCWERLTELSQSSEVSRRPDSLLVGDFLTAEVPRLEKVRDEWLDTPDVECHGRTPRSIIDRERARLPEGMSGREAAWRWTSSGVRRRVGTNLGPAPPA